MFAFCLDTVDGLARADVDVEQLDGRVTPLHSRRSSRFGSPVASFVVSTLCTLLTHCCSCKSSIPHTWCVHTAVRARVPYLTHGVYAVQL